MRQRPSIHVRLALLLALGVAGGACADTPDPFYARCATAAECPSTWLCPDPAAQGRGAVGNVCVPQCVDDNDCRDLSGDVSAYCSGKVCLIGCATAADCPTTQPYCRGSDPSCLGYLDHLFCSTADIVCN